MFIRVFGAGISMRRNSINMELCLAAAAVVSEEFFFFSSIMKWNNQ